MGIKPNTFLTMNHNIRSCHPGVIQGPIKSHLLRKKSCSCHPGISQGFRSSVSGTGGQSPKQQNERCPYFLYHLGNYKHFRSSRQEPRMRNKIYISYYITITMNVLVPAFGACAHEFLSYFGACVHEFLQKEKCWIIGYMYLHLQ